MAVYQIGKFTYPSQKAAQQALSGLLQSCRLNTPILKGAEFDLLRSLLDMHYDRENKLRGGVKAFEVREHYQPGQGKQRCFHIVHHDDATTTFTIQLSKYKRVGENQHLERALNGALRDFMQPYMTELKRVRFKGVCELTKQSLRWEDAAVHHHGEWTWSKITSEWIKQSKPDLSFMTDTPIGWQMLPARGRQFKEFHDQRAVLKIISKTENSRLGSKGYG